MALTLEQQRAYVQQGSASCPYCGEASTDGGAIEVEGTHAVQAMSCLTCHRRWQDVYVLSAIVEGGDAHEALSQA